MNGSYTITPSQNGYGFTPASQTVAVSGSNVVAPNFTSSAQVYTISGTIGGPGAAGATISLSGSSTATTTADGSGNYSFPGLLNGSYIVTPTNAGFIFTPSSQSITISGSNTTADFSSLPTVTSVSLNPASVIGGNTSIGTVTLSGPAPVGGAVVALSSSNAAAAQVPASVTVAPGATAATFTVNTTPVAGDTSLSISGTYGATQNASLTVVAAVLNTVTLNQIPILGGYSSTGTVTLSGPAPAGGALVALSSSDTSVQVPASVTVAANATTATFTATSVSVTKYTLVTVSGTYIATRAITFGVSVLPILQSVTLTPTSVGGGDSAIGAILLNGPAPAGGVVIMLSSSNTSAAQVPASVAVAANATTATFIVTTSPVSAKTSATITVTHGNSRTASVTVKPPG